MSQENHKANVVFSEAFKLAKKSERPEAASILRKASSGTKSLFFKEVYEGLIEDLDEL